MSAPAAVAVAVMAGGRARRLGGILKPTLAVHGRRVVDRQLDAFSGLFSRVLIVAGDPAPFVGLPVTVVADRVPAGAGPLAGIDAALAALASAEQAVVCVGGDMPFLDAAALVLLRDHAPEADAAVARFDGLPEPLFARYGRACAAPIARRLAAGQLKTAAFLDDVRVAWIDELALRALDPTLRFLTNVNTPEDLARAETLAARERSRE